MPETYEVYRYSDDLGGDYERPHLHETTDNLAEAQAHVAHWGGHVRRVGDGAIWDPGTERWFGDDGPLPDGGGGMMTITRDPRSMAVQQVADDYPLRYDIATGAPTAEDAAMLAMSDLLDDGRDWECYVPANWEPDAWMETYRASYQEAWEAMTNDLQRVCATCYYCRMDTEAESVALYGRVLGYGTCGRDGHTVKAPAADTCGRWWSPLAPATEEEEG